MNKISSTLILTFLCQFTFAHYIKLQPICFIAHDPYFSIWSFSDQARSIVGEFFIKSLEKHWDKKIISGS